jgi:hypothetical protein
MITTILIDHLRWQKNPRQRNTSLIEMARDFQGFEQTSYALVRAQAL